MAELTNEPTSSKHRAERALVPAWVAGMAGAGVAGVLMALCFRPWNLHALAWVAMVPWLAALPRLRAGTTWLCGIVLGLAFYRIGLGWLFALHGPMAGGIILIFAIWTGLAFRVVRMVMERLGTAAMLWAAPACFTAQEILRCEGLPQLRLAFLALGYSQSPNRWIAQIASIGGVYCLTFLVVAVNAAVAWALVRRRRRRALLPVAGVAAGVLGLAVVAQPRSYDDRPRISVACVQAEVYDYNVYTDLTRAALEHPSRPRIVVLPEHTITEHADADHVFVQRLSKLARRHGALICVGAHVAATGRACAYDNVALLIGPDGSILSAQAKVVPIPFADDGNPATTLATTPTPLGRVGTYVCYDATFTDVPRRSVALGAELLLEPAMDPKRWPPQQVTQHADIPPMRCIELRRCAVRAASSGVSQIIDATGRVVAERPRETGPGILTGEVYTVRDRTVFARGGYLFATGLGWVFLAAVLALTIADWASRAAGWRRSRRAAAGSPVGVGGE